MTQFIQVLQRYYNYFLIIVNYIIPSCTSPLHNVTAIFKDGSSVDWSTALQNYTLFMFYFVALKYNTALNQKKTQVIETEEEDKKKKVNY